MSATFNELVELMDRLRSPGGCPWDREQTYATLAPMLLEEAYEAFDALEEAREGRPAALREELGDVLFQITFFARVAKERGEFNIDDVIDEVYAKMVRRHPHVFGEAQASDSAQVLRNWEAIKAEEKRAAGKGVGKGEGALKLSNRKFRRRFRYIEEKLRDQNRKFEETTLDELEGLWHEAKKQN